MRVFSFLFIGLLWSLQLSALAEKPSGSSPSITFTRNDGQWEKNVLYKAAIPGGFLFVKATSLHYVFYDTKAMSRIHGHGSPDHPTARQQNQAPQTSTKAIRAHGFEVHFSEANPQALIEASGESPDKKNFILGNNPAHWASNVPGFGQLMYKNIYPGIDLKLYTQYASLKYEFIVAPQANSKQIKLRYEGAEQIFLNEGALTIKTSVNTITESQPYCYQSIDQAQQTISSQFVVANNEVTFAFPKGYDPQQTLVIDPVLVFSTYSGSFSDNWGFTATYDEAGNLYSGGIEFGNRFPATIGAFQFRFSGEIDVAILKYSPDGKQLLFATYLGGVEAEVPHSLIVNDANELIIFGTTGSKDFPVSANAFAKTFLGGNEVEPLGGILFSAGCDLFVTKLTAMGNALAGSTYIGGKNNDGLNTSTHIYQNYGDQFRGEVTVDKNGSIYLATTTASIDFPTKEATQPALREAQDGIVCQFTPDLSALLWSTYVGGVGYDAITSIHTGKSGDVYICGGTTSDDLTAQPNVINPIFSGASDGFVAHFKDKVLLALSYLGTDQDDQAFLMDLDKDENVYVVGQTYGAYPVTSGVYQNPGSGQFIHAMSNDLQTTLFSTVVGTGKPSPDISPTAFLVSDCGPIYLTGWGGVINSDEAIGIGNSTTIGLPVTSDGYRTTTNGDDFYLMILNENASALLYGTYFGSTNLRNHVDGGTSRFSKNGIVYHAACACRDESQFPTTSGVWSNRNNGDINTANANLNDGCNNVAFKFDLDGLHADMETPESVCTIPYEVTFSNKGWGGKTFEWTINGQVISTTSDPIKYTFDKVGDYTITFKAIDLATCQKESVVTKKLTVRNAQFQASGNVTICPGQSTPLVASGGSFYRWEPAAGLDNPRSPAPIASPSITTQYTVTIDLDSACSRRFNVQVAVADTATPDFDVQIDSECGKIDRARFVNKTVNGESFVWILGNGDTLRTQDAEGYVYSKPGTYEVVLKAFRGFCEQDLRKTITIEETQLPPNVITPNGDDKNEVFRLQDEGWKVEIYNRWGRPVFTSDSYQNNWDGTVQEGAGEGNTGVYFYHVTSPRGVTCKGWIQVLR